MSDDNTTSTVAALLGAAGLTVSDEEFERFVAIYPTVRAQADSLYMRELDGESPALDFDPTAV